MSIRTDLALEKAEDLGAQLPPGVTQEEKRLGQLTITTVRVASPEGAKALGREMGEYITLHSPRFAHDISQCSEEVHQLAKELRRLLPENGLVIVAGLGNEQITPDALGPLVARQTLATRHIPKEMAAQNGLEGLRQVAALAPGVLAQTGVETGEIISFLARGIDPAAVIAVDALAARSLARLGCTIQLSNTGISPGSGVQNARKELSRQTLGVPVVAVGVPTVVDAATLAGDLLKEAPASEQAQALFAPEGHSMMVTPRDIDLLVQRCAKIVSLAVNLALQPQLSLEDISYLLS